MNWENIIPIIIITIYLVLTGLYSVYGAPLWYRIGKSALKTILPILGFEAAKELTQLVAKEVLPTNSTALDFLDN
jgi:hypothetical protein